MACTPPHLSRSVNVTVSEVQLNNIFGYRDDHEIVSYRLTGKVNFRQFKLELAWVSHKLRNIIIKKGIFRVAIFCEDSYEFSLLFFAALSCAKIVVIPGNNKRVTANSLEEPVLLLGEWNKKTAIKLENLLTDIEEQKLPQFFTGGIQLFTSGSSGKPQVISKKIEHLLREVEEHEQKWNSLNRKITTLATVSHQHIYGLLFKLLWPLMRGRTFVSKTYADIAKLLEDAANWAPVMWIASPAQLSRRMSTWPWHLGKAFTNIFSSGGALQLEDAQAIERLCGIVPTEIYGSTETGGIAWRCQQAEPSWTPLTKVNLSATSEGLLRVNSPWLDFPFICHDRVEFLQNGNFNLLGRIDRIVKIEEKRISLSQIESMLISHDYIIKAKVLIVERRRKSIAVVAKLSEIGLNLLKTEGKARLIRKVRECLALDLEGVALPRLWRFVDEIPTNQQGKTARETLMRIFDATPDAMVPHVEKREQIGNMRKIVFKVNPGLPCLPGHFSEAPIVPGVVQIDWAMHFGRELFGISDIFSHMEVIKFKQLMLPEDLVSLNIEFNSDKIN